MSDSPINEWKLDPNGDKTDAFVDLMYQHYNDGSHWYHAMVKWDGCIELKRAYNEPFDHNANRDEDNTDCIHICNIDDYINMLIKLRDEAKKHLEIE